jgi:aspartate aminotransferase-like enzyme
LGLQVFSRAPSPSVTALTVPAGVDGAAVRKHLEQRYNITVMGGQDQLKGRILRIGHLGYLQNSDVVQTLQDLARTLIDVGFNPPATVEAIGQRANALFGQPQ